MVYRPAYLKFLAVKPQRIFIGCWFSMIYLVPPSNCTDRLPFDEIFYPYVHFTALTNSNKKYAVQTDIIFPSTIQYSSANTFVIRWTNFHTITYLLLFLQNENKRCANKAWKLLDIYNSIYSFHFSKIKKHFFQKILKMLTFSSRLMSIHTIKFCPFSLLSKSLRDFTHTQ